MYTYKYPTEEVPEGGFEAVCESFEKEIYGYSFDVLLMGITDDNPFFDTGELPDNDTDVVISSAVIFVVVLYLMLKMMLDRSTFNISLVKIFGFRSREVRQMYLDGNFYIVAIGALISIPLCKTIMDYIYPRYLVSNVGVGIKPDYPMSFYVIIFVVIMLLYLFINKILVVRIRKIDPSVVLKNRE